MLTKIKPRATAAERKNAVFVAEKNRFKPVSKRKKGRRARVLSVSFVFCTTKSVCYSLHALLLYCNVEVKGGKKSYLL